MKRAQFTPVGRADDSTWANITSVEFTLVSRPGTDVRANIDMLRSEADPERFLRAWSVVNDESLGLLNSPQGTSLLFTDTGSAGSVGTLAEVADAKDFSVTVKLSPLTAGRGGLFFRGQERTGRGLCFMIDGADSNVWSLLLVDTPGAIGGTTTLASGVVQNTSFGPSGVYWLRAVAKGDHFEVLLSADGVNFTRVASHRSGAFPFGQVGVAVYDSAAYAIYGIDFRRE
jgi:hypothetical protein